MKKTILFIIMFFIFVGGIFAAEKKPNVLFIITEDTHWNVFGCYGNPICKTPNIDKLASSGIRFEHAYCNGSACNATRTSFIHGLRPKTTQIWNNDQRIVDRLPTEFAKTNLPQLFKDGGYTTIDIGKFYHTVSYAPEQVSVFDRIEHYAKPAGWQGPPPTLEFPPVKPDVTKLAKPRALKNQDNTGLPPSELTYARLRSDSYGDSGLDFKEEADTRKGETTVALLNEFAADKNPDKKPFFLVLSFGKPHTPYLSPTKYATQYNPETIPDPPAPVSSFKDFPYLVRSTGKNPDIFREYPATLKEAKEAIAAYYGCVTFIDDALAPVLDTLEQTGLDKDTIVILIGDHGVHLGDHNMWAKYSLLEGTHRAPFILRVPGAKENGKVSREIVEFVDILPTLVDLCSLHKPEKLEGISLKPLLENAAVPWKKAAFLEDQDLNTVVRTKKYSYLEFYGPSKHVLTQFNTEYKEALFDLEKDPNETVNLADDPAYADVKKELADLLHQGWKKALPPGYENAQ
jgi:arylsulfatase A-like enzyme